MNDEKLIKTRRLSLNYAIYLRSILMHIPKEWNMSYVLEKQASSLTEEELNRLLMIKMYSNNIVLLSRFINKMNEERLTELQIDDKIYKEMMNFDIDDIIRIKFKDNKEYKEFLACNGLYKPNNSILNKGVNIYSNSDSSSDVKGKSRFKKRFNRSKRY